MKCVQCSKAKEGPSHDDPLSHAAHWGQVLRVASGALGKLDVQSRHVHYITHAHAHVQSRHVHCITHAHDSILSFYCFWICLIASSFFSKSRQTNPETIKRFTPIFFHLLCSGTTRRRATSRLARAVTKGRVATTRAATTTSRTCSRNSTIPESTSTTRPPSSYTYGTTAQVTSFLPFPSEFFLVNGRYNTVWLPGDVT